MPTTTSDFASPIARVPGAPLKSPAPEGDELDVRAHLHTLWRYRLALVLVPLVVMIAAYVFSRRMTPQYVSSTKVWVTASKFGDDRQASSVNITSFKALIENYTLAAQVIKEFKLDQPPYLMTPIDFTYNNIEITNLRDTNVLLISVRLWDSQLSAAVANQLAAEAVELANRLNTDDAVGARDTIKRQVEQARGRLDVAARVRDVYRNEAQVDLLKKDVATLLEQRGDLRRLVVQIASERARLAQAEAQMQQKTRIDTLKKSIDSDPTMLEAARRAGGDSSTLLPLEMKNEVINEVYENLDEEVASTRNTISALERQRDQLVGSVGLSQAALRQLTELYARESRLQRLDTEYDLAKTSYVEVTTRYQQAELLVASRSTQLQVIDQALPPRSPVWPRPLRNTAMAGAATFMLIALGALGVAYLRG